MNVIEKGVGMLRDVKTYWKKPAEGNYMPFREIMAYSVGGFGAYSVFTMAQALLLSTTNVIIGNTIGIQPMHMYVMYVISVVTNVPITMLRANMIDNVRYKSGKYRPYLLRMGIPTIIISLLFVFTPYSSIDYIWRCVLIFIYNFGLQFFYNFFYEAYENLVFVLSANSQERTNATAIKSMIYSLSPTVTNFITPLIAQKVAGGNMYDLTVYRWLYPFIAVVGVGLIILVYSGTEEKIVIAKSHEEKIRFFDALREVAKNKYFWITAFAGWLGFLETCAYVILQWLYNYAHLCTAEQYSFITLIRGTAYLWGMVLAPFAVKRWGKRNVLIVSNILNIVCLALVYPLMGSIWTVLLCMYLYGVTDSFLFVINPAINADIRDYQQYKSGERIDGMFGAVGLLFSFVSMTTSSVLPAIYEKYGIYSGNGYENMYDALYDLPTLYRLIGVLVILSVVGATLNLIPYFFYDLTDVKQKAIVRILKIRALFEDYGNGVITDEDMQIARSMISDAKKCVAAGGTDLSALKKQKAPRSELKAAAKANEEYEMSKALLEELDRFTTPAGKAKLERARAVVSLGIAGAVSADGSALSEARALPRETAEQRLIRREAIADAMLSLRCKKAAEKYYPNGPIEFDEAALDALYDEEKALSEKRAELLRGGGGKAEIAAVAERLRVLSREIRSAQEEHRRYLDCTKAFREAEKYVTQAKNYESFLEQESV